MDVDCPIGSTCQDGKWMGVDAAGNPLGLPLICMQTITVTPGLDGGP
jgi:hypothetical protein